MSSRSGVRYTTLREVNMPKYYVTCLDRSTIVTGRNHLDACVKASDKLCVSTAGVYWSVSERGFGKHEDDVMISDRHIIEEQLRRFREK